MPKRCRGVSQEIGHIKLGRKRGRNRNVITWQSSKRDIGHIPKDNTAYFRGEFRRMVYGGLLMRLELADFRMASTRMFLGLAKSNSGLITTPFPGIA